MPFVGAVLEWEGEPPGEPKLSADLPKCRKIQRTTHRTTHSFRQKSQPPTKDRFVRFQRNLNLVKEKGCKVRWTVLLSLRDADDF